MQCTTNPVRGNVRYTVYEGSTHVLYSSTPYAVGVGMSKTVILLFSIFHFPFSISTPLSNRVSKKNDEESTYEDKGTTRCVFTQK